jgi:hypothetical protein
MGKRKFFQIAQRIFHSPSHFLSSIGLVEPLKWSKVEHCGVKWLEINGELLDINLFVDK